MQRVLYLLALVGPDQPPTRRMTQNHVAAGLMLELNPDSAERVDAVGTVAGRKAAHSGASTISSVIGAGTGSPCFPGLLRYPWTGVAELVHCLLTRPALGDTARPARSFGREHAVLIWPNPHTEFHCSQDTRVSGLM